MKLSRNSICVLLIVIFHVVGLTGFLIPAFNGLFKQLVPFHLLLMLSLMIFSQPEKSYWFYVFLVVTYIAGYTIELVGVHTGMIFGEYSYGGTLGLKLAEIPLMIGVNWILVIYSAGMLLRQIGLKNNVLAAAVGSVLVTLLDFIIEPVAIRFDYWAWKTNDIPLQNYIAWYLFSFALLYLFARLPFKKHNPAAPVLFITQFLFFLILLSMDS